MSKVILTQPSNISTYDENQKKIVVVQKNTPVLVKLGEGPVGPPGPQGIQGVPGTTVQKISGGVLSAQRIVFIDSNGKAYYADKDTPAHINKVLGLTLSAVITDEIVDILTFGENQDPTFNFDMTKPIWLGNNGLFTQTYPTTGFALQVGFPTADDAMMIELQMPIIIS